MQRYGQTLTWGAIAAPHLFTGDCLSYSLRDAVTEQEIENESADLTALVLHSRKAMLSFEAQVNSGTTNFLDLSAGAELTVSGISGGMVLATSTEESWVLEQPKKASVQAIWYPSMTGGSGASAGTGLNIVTPSQSGLMIVAPGGVIVYGTYGLTHAAGIVHSLKIRQRLKISEDDVDPTGVILGAASHGYKRTISLELLATGTKPAVNSTLSITGAPTTANDYVITSSDEMWAVEKGKMYSVEASWITPFGTS